MKVVNIIFGTIGLAVIVVFIVGYARYRAVKKMIETVRPVGLQPCTEAEDGKTGYLDFEIVNDSSFEFTLTDPVVMIVDRKMKVYGRSEAGTLPITVPPNTKMNFTLKLFFNDPKAEEDWCNLKNLDNVDTGFHFSTEWSRLEFERTLTLR